MDRKYLMSDMRPSGSDTPALADTTHANAERTPFHVKRDCAACKGTGREVINGVADGAAIYSEPCMMCDAGLVQAIADQLRPAQ